MPDATGLELIAQELRDADAGAVLDTVYFREQAAVLVAPAGHAGNVAGAMGRTGTSA